MLKDNTPHEFRLALESLRSFLRGREDQPRVATINAWNEWPEGSFLEPGRRHGTDYLEAVRRVFG